MKSGTLTVVGTGYLVAGQATIETLACIEKAQKLFYLVTEPATSQWLESLNPTAESLQDCYAVGKHRYDTYREMVERMLAPVRKGRQVVTAFYGHPGVFVYPSHEAVRRAREEGFSARMLPGISAEDCLFADVGIDPALYGCQSFEATDFLIHRRKIDSSSHLILWQVGAIGVTDYQNRELWSRSGLRVLAEALQKTYSPGHEVVIYEAAQYPVCEPLIKRVTLAKLAKSRVTVISTLYVPPRRKARLDKRMMARLGLSASR